MKVLKGKPYVKKVKMHQKSNVEVLKKLKSFQTGEIFLSLRFWQSESIFTDKILPRQEVYKKDGNVFYKYGVQIENLKETFENISRQEELIITFTHTMLGWGEIDGEKIFLSYNSVPNKSEYSGNFDIKPKGTYEKWKKIISQYAMPTTALQLAIVIGLSAVMVGYLKDLMDGSIFLHLFGESSKGKTTFAMLSVSTAANPNINCSNTVISDWGDTENFRVSLLSNNFGFPIVYDEFSKASKKGNSEFIYSVANGKSKGRLSSSGNKQETETWKCTIISTGEQSILASCNSNEGLLARTLEMNLEKITSSAHSAESLKKGISENYGHANLIFAKFILENDVLIKEKFTRWRETLENEIPFKNNLVSRLIKKIAVLMLTADTAKSALQLDFDIDKLKNILINSVIKQNELIPFSKSESLIDYLLQDMLAHSDRYVTIKNTIIPFFSSNTKAVVKEVSEKTLNTGELYNTEVMYLSTEFSELLAKGGFADLSTCLKELKNLGYLVCDKGRNTVKRRIDGKMVRVYLVRFPKDLYNVRNNKKGKEIL